MTYVKLANALHITLDYLSQDMIKAASEQFLDREYQVYFDNLSDKQRKFMQVTMMSVNKIDIKG